MSRDPLQVLMAMRRRSVEQARYALGTCLAAEQQLANQIGSLDDTVRRDRETGLAWPNSHQFLELSATWMKAMRTERHTVVAALKSAEIRSRDARGVVSGARSDAELVEQLIQERTAADHAEATRRDQHVLDDIARARLTVRRVRDPAGML